MSLVGDGPVGLVWGYLVDGLRLGVVGVAKKCLVARVEILMGAEPKMTSFLVEDLDEVLELSD